MRVYGSKLPRQISVVSAAFLILIFISAHQHLAPAMAQQRLGELTNQKIPVESSNFTNYTNPEYGFSLHYPIAWVNEEIDPGANLNFLMTFDPPPSEFGQFVFFYLAVKNLTDNNTSLKQFTDQEIDLLNKPPAVTSPTEGAIARLILESQPTTIGGETQAHELVYTEKVSGTLSKITEIYAVNRDKGYILSYFVAVDAYEKYLPMFEKMVDSFNLTTSPI
jgi:eukaryotic-like serine/threonine-protein kinase